MRIPSTRRIAPTTLRRRIVAAVFVVSAMVALAAGPAAAQGSGDNVRDQLSDRRIGVGNVFLAENEAIDSAVVAIDGNASVAGSTTEGVLVVSGDAIVSGSVGGSVLVIDGNARISGTVADDVVAIGGRAIIDDGAVVRGDVRSSKDARVASGATVRGEIKDIDVTGMFTALGFSLLAFFWLAVTVSTAILGAVLLALFGRAFDTAAATARTVPGKSIGWGLLVSVGLPVIAVAGLFSIVGFPIGLGTGGALGVIGALGYLTSALWLGRLMIRAPRNIFGAFFAGWGILRVLALIPGLGMLVWTVASIFGVGALTVAAWRASRGPAAETTPTDEPATDEPAAPEAEPAPAVATKTATKTVKKTTTTSSGTTKESGTTPEKPAKT
jgi:hypothetical protein